MLTGKSAYVIVFYEGSGKVPRVCDTKTAAVKALLEIGCGSVLWAEQVKRFEKAEASFVSDHCRCYKVQVER